MTTEYIDYESEQDWLDMRVQDITSTESAALFGLSPYTTELELFHRKKDKVDVEFQDNARMKAGRYLEPSIAQLAGDELSCEVSPFKCYSRDPQDRMGSSFDFMITSGEFDRWILEIKNVDFIVYKNNWEDDEAPDHIEVQVQHQLELTGRPGAIIAALVGGNDLRLIKRERNKKMGAGIRQRIRQFWQDVETGNEPKPDYERDARFIIDMHPGGGQEIMKADTGGRIHYLMQDYANLKSQAKILDEQANACKAEILDLIGDDVKKVTVDNLSLTCGRTKDTPPQIITADMVGTEFGGRKGYRQFRVTEKKK